MPTQDWVKGDSWRQLREKYNANLAILNARRENPIAAINASPETEKIHPSRFDIVLTEADVPNLPWTKINKAGSSLLDLETRSAGVLNSGILPDARLSTNIPRINAGSIFDQTLETLSHLIASNDVVAGGLLQANGNLLLGANVAIAATDDIYIRVSSAANKPALRYHPTGAGTGVWQFSNDGLNWTDMGAGGGGGGGITSLGGQTGASQTFANDTNVTIGSAANVHTLGWQGQLAVARGGTGSGTAAGARTNLGLIIGTDIQAQNSNLAALAANATNGFWVRTGAGAGAARALVAGAGISITNGDAVSGNPTISSTVAAFLYAAPGDTNTLQSANDEREVAGDVFADVKEFRLGLPGRYRVSIELSKSGAAAVECILEAKMPDGARLAASGVATLSGGTVHPTFGSPQNLDMNITVPMNANLIVRLRSTSAVQTAYIRNVQVKFSTTASAPAIHSAVITN